MLLESIGAWLFDARIRPKAHLSLGTRQRLISFPARPVGLGRGRQNGPFSSESKVSTNWSNTWKHACYCAFMYTFTEEHVCFHVILYLVLTFDPTGKGSITTGNVIHNTGK